MKKTNMKMTWICGIALVLLLSLLVWPHPTAASPTAQTVIPAVDLGHFDGGVVSVMDINELGQVVGYGCWPSGICTGFRWDPILGGEMKYLNTFWPSSHSEASAINEQGQVAGHYIDNSGVERAFLWEVAGGVETVIDLGSLFGPTTLARALDINEQGQVVGGSEVDRMHDGVYDVHAFLWDDVNGMIDLDPWLSQYTLSYAGAINDQGHVVGMRRDVNGNLTGFLHDGTQMQTLHPLLHDSLPVSLNNLDQVAGHMSPYPSMPNQAFLWEWDGVGMSLTSLGTLGGDYSVSQDINDAGQVVGTSRVANGEDHGFLWDRVNGMVDLNANIADPAMTSPSLLNVTSSTPRALNELGQVVGRIHSDVIGERHAFLWQGGIMTELAPLVGSSFADAMVINNQGQAAGVSDGNDGYPHAVLWMIPLPPPPPPQAVIDELSDAVAALVEADSLNAGVGNALTVKLDAAAKHVQKERTKPAANVLGAFVNQSQSLMEREVLTPEEALPLIDGATDLIERLSD